MFYIDKDKDSYNLDKDEILHISKDNLKNTTIRITFKQFDIEGESNYLDIETLETIQEANDFIGWLSYELELNKARVRTYGDFIEFNKSPCHYRVI